MRCVNVLKNSRLVFHSTGEPSSVLRYVEDGDIADYSTTERHRCHVKMLFSAINPSDLHVMKGMYPAQLGPVNVAGGEGIGMVLEVGKDVTNVKVDDFVILSKPITKIGTWQGSFKCEDTDLFALNRSLASKLKAETLSIVSINPITAYRMLYDFADLQEGDIIIQTGATSAVGLYVIQMAREIFKCKTVNVIRDSSHAQAVKDLLINEFGADVVLTEKETRNFDFEKTMGRKAKTGLTIMGGDINNFLMKNLQSNASLVVYGNINEAPLTISVGQLIFSNIRVSGFWVSRWIEQHADKKERTSMMDHILQLFVDGKIRESPYVVYPLKDFKDAIKNNTLYKGVLRTKALFSCQ